MSDKKQQTAKDNEQVENQQSAPDNQKGLSASISLTEAEPTDKETQKKPSTSDTQNVKSPPKSESPVKKTPTKTPAKHSNTVKPKRSKTAVVALLIALLAIAASAGHYYWAMQQNKILQQQLNTANNASLLQNKRDVAKQLSLQKQALDTQLQTFSNNIKSESQEKITLLEQQISVLSQNKPSDWLLHEAEYLIRVASRSLWLEKDTTAAINLLHDAEQRIAELNDPQLLSIRQTLHEDIAKLQLLPKLETERVILKLMAIEQQVKELPLAMVEIPDATDSTNNLELTSNADDWRENLAKTWRKFLADFITVSRRTGNVEPLMSPEFQQNLRENLSLKLQTAIWAVRKSNSEIYTNSLIDIQQWLTNYFDMSKNSSQNFSQVVEQLKSEIISAEYPNNLSALSAIRQLIQVQNKPVTKKLKIIEPSVTEPTLEKIQELAPKEPVANSNADKLEDA